MALLAQLREPAVLRQETKPRMYRVRPCDNRSADNPVHTQVALRRRSRSDTDRLVRKLRMKRLPVGFRIYGHRLDSHLSAGADNPNRNLASIGN